MLIHYSSTYPSGKSSSYIIVSGMGFLYELPQRLPEQSIFLPLTFVKMGIQSLSGTTMQLSMYFYRASTYVLSPSSVFLSFISWAYGRTISSSYVSSSITKYQILYGCIPPYSGLLVLPILAFMIFMKFLYSYFKWFDVISWSSIPTTEDMDINSPKHYRIFDQNYWPTTLGDPCHRHNLLGSSFLY